MCEHVFKLFVLSKRWFQLWYYTRNILIQLANVEYLNYWSICLLSSKLINFLTNKTIWVSEFVRKCWNEIRDTGWKNEAYRMDEISDWVIDWSFQQQHRWSPLGIFVDRPVESLKAQTDRWSYLEKITHLKGSHWSTTPVLKIHFILLN